MKLHPPILKAICAALGEIFQENKYADKVIERHFKANKKWGARDRRFFAEAVYDMVRWWRRLQWSTQSDDPWLLLAGWLTLKELALPDWREFSDFSSMDFLKAWNSPPQRAIAQSLPDWLDALGEEQLGDNWSQVIEEMNHQAPAFLRTNSLLGTPQALQLQLEGEGVSTELQGEICLKLKQRKNVFITEAFKKGLFEMQDQGSQDIAPFLKVEPGQRVVDACAGAGGKSLHLAALMQNKGKIIALDIHPWKLNELKRRARRARVDIIETRAIENSKVVKRLHGSADRLLLDVPCSGSGVFRRNPDSKYKLSQNEIENLQKTQREILHNYSKILKPGGMLVYSTCSVFPIENNVPVQAFLEANSNEWQLEQEHQVFPTKSGPDGFYMARLKLRQ